LKVADPGQKDIKGDPTAEIHIDEPVGNSETKAVTEDVNKIYTGVEVNPEPQGGYDRFYKYLSNAIKYPAIDKENNTQGKVMVQFVVERDGSLTDVKAVRGPSQSLQDEAVRAVKSAPRWTPGKQNVRQDGPLVNKTDVRCGYNLLYR
jgi:protein TonB